MGSQAMARRIVLIAGLSGDFSVGSTRYSNERREGEQMTTPTATKPADPLALLRTRHYVALPE